MTTATQTLAGTITAAFQGVLNIPLYLAPYTVNLPWLGLPSSGATMGQMGGDSACLSAAYARGAANQVTSIQKASAVTLYPGAAYTATVGGGYAAGSGGQVQSGYALPIQNNVFWGLESQQSPLTPGMGSLGVAASAYDLPAVLLGMNASAAAIPLTSANMQLRPLQKIAVGISTIPGLYYPGVMATFSPNSGVGVAVAGQMLGLTGLGNLIFVTGTSALGSYAQSYALFCILDYASGNNFLWLYNSLGTTLQITTMTCNYIIASATHTLGVNPLSFTFNFDNAALNTAIGNSTLIPHPCANGVLFTPAIASSVNNDYYVSKDGTRYWQLNYVPQTSGAKLRSPNQEPTFSKYFDANGYFWYVGANAFQSGTTFRPITSFGANIPFQPVTLPQIPPMAFPCWSPCLGRVGGSPGTLFNSING